MLLTCLQAAREIDDAHNSAAKAEAEASGLRAALDAARNRHFEQLTRWACMACHLHVIVTAAGQSPRSHAVAISMGSGYIHDQMSCLQCQVKLKPL